MLSTMNTAQPIPMRTQTFSGRFNYAGGSASDFQRIGELAFSDELIISWKIVSVDKNGADITCVVSAESPQEANILATTFMMLGLNAWTILAR